MLTITIAGNLGRDAEHKTTSSSELCSFPVAASVGYGDNKQTYWVDVTKWGKGSEGLARILRKGSKVTVSGELTMREHNGKTYLQCRADHVTIQGTPQGQGGGNQSNQGTGGATTDIGQQYNDLEDDVPFLTSEGIH